MFIVLHPRKRAQKPSICNIFYLLATRTGFMVTAVVITALYPAPTVLLQRFIRGEKLNVFRIVGLVLAITGAALIGIGG